MMTIASVPHRPRAVVLGGLASIVSFLSLACGTVGDRRDELSGSSASNPATDGGAETTVTTEESGSQATGDTDEPTHGDGQPPRFDLGPLSDAGVPADGCGAIDFLFVIDNSLSMAERQAQLLASFPGFIDAMEASLGEMVDSYHVGVITSDAYEGNAAGCQTLGDLVTRTSGPTSGNQACTPFAEGKRFATEADDLEVAFPCMGQVGILGNLLERPVSATVAALDPAKAGLAGCNEGFLRDDAVLVVVIVTDDIPWEDDLDDAHPNTDTSGWYDAIVAAKNGDPEAMVVIGFVPWNDTSCVSENRDSPNLIDFVSSFGEQGVLASVCAPDYSPVFADAVSRIVTACETFVPPG